MNTETTFWIKKRTLEKKLISTLLDTKITHTQKDQNHVYEMSAGMYELYRSEAVRFYDCSQETAKFKTAFKNILDAKNSVVETQIRVHQKTQRGCGDLNFALNLYHTTSRMMANGKHTEIFLTDHKKIVENIMGLQMVHSLDSMLKKAVEEQLNNI